MMKKENANERIKRAMREREDYILQLIAASGGYRPSVFYYAPTENALDRLVERGTIRWDKRRGLYTLKSGHRVRYSCTNQRYVVYRIIHKEGSK